MLSDEADVAKGSIKKHLNTLSDFDYLEGNGSKQVIGVKGEAILHELWQITFVVLFKMAKYPFEQVCSKFCSIEFTK